MSDAAQAGLVRRHGSWRTLLLIAVPIVIADQATKVMIRRALELHDSIAVIPGFLDLTHVRNTGAAFGLLPERTTLLSVLSVIAVVAIVSTLGTMLRAALSTPCSRYTTTRNTAKRAMFPIHQRVIAASARRPSPPCRRSRAARRG